MSDDEFNGSRGERVEDFFWAREAPEVQQHQGKFVVVRNRRVIAVGTNRQAVLKQAASQERCSEDDLIVMIVPRGGLDAEIRH